MESKYKLLSRYLVRYKKWAVIGGLFMIIGVLLLIPTPLLTMYLIDTILPASDLHALLFITFLCVVILLCKAVCDNIQGLYFCKFNQKVVFDIQLDVLKVFQQKSTHYRHEKQTGYLMSRLTDDPNRLQNLFADTVIALLRDVITLLVGVGIVFWINWRLALASILLLPAFVLVLKRYNKKMKVLAYEQFETNAVFTKKLQESISLIDTLFIHNALIYDTIKLIQAKKASVYSFIQRTVVQNFGSSLISLIGGLGPIIVLGYGFYEIMHHSLTLGQFIAFNSFLGYIYGPTSRLVSASFGIQQSVVAWDRIYEVLCSASKVSGKKEKVALQGKIEFRQVDLFYGDKQVLFHINYTIDPGKVIAIVGESGSGKSSLLSLLTGLNQCTRGSIYVDGKSLEEIQNYRDSIAFVEQEPMVLSATIWDNLLLGRNYIPMEEVVSAAKMAEIHSYIESLPAQYNTLMNENGRNMSIGQKQRLAIARCIVRQPAVFLMDEPTANLDADTEYKIIHSILPFLQNRTTIIVSHRLKSISFADEIIVMSAGRIKEKGNHAALMQQRGLYYKLWINQNGHAH